MRVSPVLQGLGEYPFLAFDRAIAEARGRGAELIDFGMGDPYEETEPFIREALVGSLPARSRYPRSAGLPELRAAIAGWCRRRFGVELDPQSEIVPTLGSKEAIFSFAALVDLTPPKNLVLVTEPGYPVPLRGARFAGAEPMLLPLREENGFLPDLDAVPEEAWSRAALVWVNYPNNPTGAVAPLALFERLAELAVEHDFLLCSDEAYCEIYFGDPPHSALEVADRRSVVAFNTLSKRSSMTGYRSGFVAASPDVVEALRAFRPSTGTAPQEFVQRASIAAWEDEEHVRRTRERYAAKRAVLLEALAAAGLEPAGSEATFFLWVRAPGGDSVGFARQLLDVGVVVAPGASLGAAGEGYVRFALVPTLPECERAASLLARGL
ncbi:MAG: aminotransferase class I/II-fold pyridoxal phosphate-dependent enzyme [Gaiellaceae bacterium]